MDYRLTDEQLALKREFNEFFAMEMKEAPTGCGGLVEPITPDAHRFHREMMKKIAKKGWNIMAWPKEYGGRGAPIIEQLLFNESQAYHLAPGIDPFGVHMFGPTLMLYASEEQKKRLLPPIARGEVVYCQGWSEPNAGSDLASLTTMAVKKGDYYVINGQKTWITGAHNADCMFLLARTDPKSKRNKGLSVFYIGDLKAKGIEIRPIEYMNREHTYNEVFFTDLKVSVEDRIGPENDGWKVSRDTMNFERSNAGIYITVLRMLVELLKHVKTTRRGGKYLSEHPGVRSRLARLYMDVEVGRALAYRIAWLQEGGNLRLSPAAASESKVFGTELLLRGSQLILEVMGLYGQLESSKWTPLDGFMTTRYQYYKSKTISAGSNEIQRNIIAWAGLELPRLR